MRIGNRIFSPNPWPSIATVLVVPLFIALGFWQLDRADQKKSLHESFLQNQSEQVLSLNRYDINKEEKRNILWRKVIVSGNFIENIQILLDNQVVNKQAGYYVFTPFLLKSKNIIYLVNRGWVPAGQDRQKVPLLRFNWGDTLITGIIKQPPETGILLGEDSFEHMAKGVIRVNKIDMSKISGLLNGPLMPYVVRLDPESKHGYTREWKQPGSGEAVHLGYAFQWFVLAALVLVIYFAVNLKKVRDEEPS